jgi:hypothetical protein
MALITNHISGAVDAVDGYNRSIVAITGSTFFVPNVGDGGARGVNVLAPDAAYIFSGTLGGTDKTVFFGDVVVSGTLTGAVTGEGAASRAGS